MSENFKTHVSFLQDYLMSLSITQISPFLSHGWNGRGGVGTGSFYVVITELAEPTHTWRKLVLHASWTHRVKRNRTDKALIITSMIRWLRLNVLLTTKTAWIMDSGITAASISSSVKIPFL